MVQQSKVYFTWLVVKSVSGVSEPGLQSCDPHVGGWCYHRLSAHWPSESAKAPGGPGDRTGCPGSPEQASGGGHSVVLAPMLSWEVNVPGPHFTQ